MSVVNLSTPLNLRWWFAALGDLRLEFSASWNTSPADILLSTVETGGHASDEPLSTAAAALLLDVLLECLPVM